MATTRLGLGAPSAAYAGFAPKETAPVISSVADIITILVTFARRVTVAIER